MAGSVGSARGLYLVASCPQNPKACHLDRSSEGPWHHPDENERRLWREAIKAEFRSMIKRGVWRKVKRSTIPNGKRCVKCKWVFKIKRDGRHKARLVACGYSQVPGVNFEESYAPVLNDVAFRIILIAAIVWKLDIKVIDIETAFLHGDLDGMEVYMDCPQGLEGAQPDECLLLQKTIYGLVQSARQYWKKFTGVLKKIGFQGGVIDPCLYVRR